MEIPLAETLEKIKNRRTTRNRYQRSESTLRVYGAIINKFNRFPEKPNEKLIDKARRFIEQYKDKNTGRLVYSALKAAFVASGLAWFDPNNDPMPPPKITEEVERPFYTPEEIIKIFKEAQWSIRNQLLLRITWLSGARAIQVASIKRTDWDPRRGTLMIPGAKMTPAGEWLVDPETKRLLESYLEGHTSEYLFPGRSGKGHITTDTIRIIFEKYCKRAGVEYRQPGMKHGKGVHGARRGRVTYLYSTLGFDVDEIMKVLRWKSPLMVHTYIRTLAGKVQEDIARRDPFYGSGEGEHQLDD